MEGLPEWKRIKPVFDKWNDILENQVTFTLEDSEKHTGRRTLQACNALFTDNRTASGTVRKG